MVIITELANLRQLSVGPEAALSLLVGQIITQLTMSDPHSIPDHPEKIAIAIALMTTLQVRVTSGTRGRADIRLIIGWNDYLLPGYLPVGVPRRSAFATITSRVYYRRRDYHPDRTGKRTSPAARVVDSACKS